ncbi:MAG: dienelactone hydrolase family protein [Mycobacteriales bacterium]
MSYVDLSSLSRLSGGSQPLGGYQAVPAGDGPWPGVVMVHEAFGLDDVMRRQADRLAAAGYLTIAPDLFSAGGARRCLVSTLRSLSSGRGRAYADIEAARAWLRSSKLCTGKIGIIGFCMGGGFALMAAARGYDAAAPNYGQLPKDLDATVQGACPVVASYGGRDITLRGAAGKLEAALTRAGIEHDVKEYPAAGHAFMNDGPAGPRLLQPLLKVMNVGPEPESATDAWRRIEAFFSQHLR